jgi:hypothetical protein
MTLRFPFTRDRFEHRLVERVGDVCLVERVNQVTRGVHWEVIVVQHRRARTLPNGRTVSAGEAYPSAERWGTAGWTYTTLPGARERFAEQVGRAPGMAVLA